MGELFRGPKTKKFFGFFEPFREKGVVCCGFLRSSKGEEERKKLLG